MKRDAYIQILQLLGIFGLAIGVAYLSKPLTSSEKEPIVLGRAPHVGDKEPKNDSHLMRESFPKKTFYRPYHVVRNRKVEKSFPGITVFGVNDAQEVLLVNHRGTILKSWPIDADRAVFLPKFCNLLAIHGTVSGAKVEPWKSLRHVIREYNWQGQVAWEFRGEGILHHDVRRLSNGDTVVLEQARVPYAGNDSYPETLHMKTDGVRIVNEMSQIVWSWNLWEHASHDFCGIRECPTSQDSLLSKTEMKRRRDWSHSNTVSVIRENRWYDGGDDRFRPGNVMVHVRNFWMSFIIDRETKDIVWRFPTRRDIEQNPSLKIYGGHESRLIPPGLPGEGNMLILDNGSVDVRPYSRVLEVNPVTRKIVWSYEDREHFFTRTAGAVQRLPNGNTLISEDLHGRVFEVTQIGEVVWEMKLPFRVSRAKRYSKPSPCFRSSEL
ncbi:MAG: aryl-sulfate sulfotransferase [Bdellovibrionales bacterium]|nr:aryl-sulfate sulfotransferase [Bdellovibrionales bacterium]